MAAVAKVREGHDFSRAAIVAEIRRLQPLRFVGPRPKRRMAIEDIHAVLQRLQRIPDARSGLRCATTLEQGNQSKSGIRNTA